VDIRLQEIQRRLDDNGKKIKLDVDSHAMDWLASAGYSPMYGARPMARLIQTEILNPLSKLLLQARVRDGEFVRVGTDLRKNRLVVLPNQWVILVPKRDNKG
jgi:ATP-dependent Clp protease ATP-binding subunit ClpB